MLPPQVCFRFSLKLTAFGRFFTHLIVGFFLFPFHYDFLFLFFGVDRPDFVEGMSSLDMMDLHYNLNHMLVTSISYNRFERDAARDADLLRPLREAPTRRRVPLNLRREHVQKSSAAEDLTIAPRSISLLL